MICSKAKVTINVKSKVLKGKKRMVLSEQNYNFVKSHRENNIYVMKIIISLKDRWHDKLFEADFLFKPRICYFTTNMFPQNICLTLLSNVLYQCLPQKIKSSSISINIFMHRCLNVHTKIKLNEVYALEIFFDSTSFNNNIAS